LNRHRIRITTHGLKGASSQSIPYPVPPGCHGGCKFYRNSHGLNDPYVLFLLRLKQPISSKQIAVLLKKYCGKAKLPTDKHHAHTLRHSVAVHMLDSGFNEEEVKDRLGHRDIRSTDLYAKISNKKRAEIGRRMDKANFIVKA